MATPDNVRTSRRVSILRKLSAQGFAQSKVFGAPNTLLWAKPWADNFKCTSLMADVSGMGILKLLATALLIFKNSARSFTRALKAVSIIAWINCNFDFFMRLARAKQILNLVDTTYNNIAASFSKTRSVLWPEMTVLASHLKPNWSVLDAGCGNGRLYQALEDKSIIYQGVDQSANLIAIARIKYPQLQDHFKVGSILSLPYNHDQFEAVFLLAVLHHVPSFELRLQAVKEIARVLKKDGLLLMTNWNLARFKHKLVLANLWGMLTKGDDWGDLFIPWKAEGQLEQRYYHAFSRQELDKLCQAAGLVEVELWGAGVMGGDRQALGVNLNKAQQLVSVWKKV